MYHVDLWGKAFQAEGANGEALRQDLPGPLRNCGKAVVAGEEGARKEY